MKKTLKKIYKKDGQDKLLSRLSLFVFDRSRTAAILWLCLTLFGIFSYTTFLKREGFPSINIPYSILAGSYLVNDAGRVDKEVAKPINDIALKDNRVKSVTSSSQNNFYSVAIQYKEGVDAQQAGQDLEQTIKGARILPEQAGLKAENPKFGFTERGDDMVISVYAKQKGEVPTETLAAEGNKLVDFITSKNLADVTKVSIVDPFIQGTDPATGQQTTTQVKFDRYGQRANDQNIFYDSVAVGIMQKGGTDVIKLEERVQQILDEYNSQNTDSQFSSVISASYAHDIKDQISELQRALLEGLLAVLIIGSIVIAIRASFVTVIAMLTVLAITLGVIFSIGYTLNTITLFALILCLGLIVDDTIIMVEAIDAQRRRHKDRREIIQIATRKISRAMVAATLTAVLSFAPLLFVGGILGSFIKAIPVTVISSLLISLLVALIFIPLFSRYLLLGKKQLGAINVHEPAAGIEAKIAKFIGKPMLWARNSRKRLVGVGLTAVFVGLAFIMAGGFIFQKVTFNIFPPSKDSNGLSAQMTFKPGTTIAQAQEVADRADAIIGQTLGQNFTTSSYYASGGARGGNLIVYITPYTDRDVRAPELANQLNSAFKNFDGAKVKVGQLDVGPPPSAFSVHIQSDDRQAAEKLATDLNAFLLNRQLERPSGKKATITETIVSDPGTFTRSEGKLYTEVSANFDATDTTTLVTLTQQAVEKEFNADKLQQYGLDSKVLKFDFGQEDENQESFASLALAFPVMLFAIYILLAIQFRSLAQPLLIFMAIPFSFFGITLGLYLTDNSFSFFAMLGFFALIGLSIKNTILLTDYANQLRREGAPAVDAVVGALSERFRPLIATSFTAVVSLIPLALSSPFWEGLVVVLIFGLLSSTFLVITVFPYYYLGAEFVRLRISRWSCLAWLGTTIVLGVTASMLSWPPLVAMVGSLLTIIILTILGKQRKQRRVIA